MTTSHFLVRFVFQAFWRQYNDYPFIIPGSVVRSYDKAKCQLERAECRRMEKDHE